MIGSHTIGNIPVGTVLSTEVIGEDFSIAQHIVDNYPKALDSGASNMEVDAFKDTTSAGRCLDFYNGKLYFAINNFVYCTKTFDVEHVDVRYMVVAGFPENVTAIAHVNDGLYIGTASNTYFLKGSSPHPEDGGFEQVHIAKHGIFYGSIARYLSDLTPDAKVKNTNIFWYNELGVFTGGNSGSYNCLSLNQTLMPWDTAGQTVSSFIIKQTDGTNQYVICLGTDVVVVNLETNAHSRYTNYYFNSFFKYNNKFYGANSTGVYLLEGLKDITTDISAFVTTCSTDFSKEENKMVCDAFIDARIDEEILLNVGVDEDTLVSSLSIITGPTQTIKRRRVKIPKGLVGNSWQFTLQNVNGAFFKLFNFEIITKTVQRRI